MNTSCSSVYRFSIDVQDPAVVTLPVFAQNVLIIDNTVTQPLNYGITQIFNGQPVNTDSLSLDSMVRVAGEEISIVLDESNFFNTIALYNSSLRTDTGWLSRTVLSQEKQSELYEIGDFNTLFVIDRLLFSFKQDVKRLHNNESSSMINNIIAEGMITCSVYYLGRENPISTFSISDSLFLRTLDFNDSITVFKKIPEYVLYKLSYILGNLAAKRIIPTWKTVSRMLYVGNNSRMQEAAGYALNNKWAISESIWNDELEKRKKFVDKAKIAFNLAVANEMQDKIGNAFVWAENAIEYLKHVDREKNLSEIVEADNYLMDLSTRLQNNRLLDVQWGNE